MKQSDLNALLLHIEKELQGFKLHYKLRGEIYMLRNIEKTKGIEFRFITSRMVRVQKYNFIKNEADKNIGDAITHESTYKFTTLQSVKMLKFFEAIV